MESGTTQSGVQKADSGMSMVAARSSKTSRVQSTGSVDSVSRGPRMERYSSTATVVPLVKTSRASSRLNSRSDRSPKKRSSSILFKMKPLLKKSFQQPSASQKPEFPRRSSSELQEHRLRQVTEDLNDDNVEGFYRAPCCTCGRKLPSTAMQLLHINRTYYTGKYFVHWMLSLSWSELILAQMFMVEMVVGFFTVCFVLFDEQSFEDAFDQSVHTFLTIGYGHIALNNSAGHVIVFFESFLSLVILAVAAGVPYVKLAKPKSTLTFAHPLVNEGPLGPQLTFRTVCNSQGADLLNVEFTLTLAHTETNRMGESFIFFDELELVEPCRPHITTEEVFSHNLSKESPLYKYLRRRCQGKNRGLWHFFLILNTRGMDLTYQTEVHATRIFQMSDLRFDRKFTKIIKLGKGKFGIQRKLVYYDCVNHTERVDAAEMIHDDVINKFRRIYIAKRDTHNRLTAVEESLFERRQGNRLVCCSGKGYISVQQWMHSLGKAKVKILTKIEQGCSSSFGRWQRTCYWKCLKLPFALIIIFALAVWSLVILILALLLLVPFFYGNGTAHVINTINQTEMSPFASTFIFSLHTISTVGFGFMIPGNIIK